jgi:hypothetical protein
MTTCSFVEMHQPFRGPVPVAVRYKARSTAIACCDRGFESQRGHGGLSVVSVVCRQVEVSATR